MDTITVRKLDATTYEVTVASRTTTTHRVTADPAYVAKLAGDPDQADDLVRRSFEFLLQREPNTSILSRFDLSVIERYFPEYEGTIRKR